MTSYEDYYDEYSGGIFVPNWGLEEWCNMPGRYTFFVAAGVPTSDVSICAVAVMGTRYLRVEPVVDSIEVKFGDQSILTV